MTHINACPECRNALGLKRGDYPEWFWWCQVCDVVLDKFHSWDDYPLEVDA